MNFIFTIQNFIKKHLLLPLLIIVFLLLNYKFLNIDLWNDEIYTLKYFVLKSYNTIITDYHVPNNHVLMNIIYRFYLNCIGLNTLNSCLESPFLLRLPQILFSIVTLIYVYKIGLINNKKSIAFWALVFLITTIPYGNFAFQIRAYSLSTMLFAMFIFYNLKYLINTNTKYLFFISSLTALSMYALPSNIYFIVGFLLFFAILIIIKTFKIFPQIQFSYLQIVMPIFYILVGIAIALALYTPIIHNVFSNGYVVYHPFHLYSIRAFFPRLYIDLISGRFILIVLFFFGLYKLIKNKNLSLEIILYCSIFIAPFILVFITGNTPPMRIYIYMSVPFSLLLANFMDSFSFQIFKEINFSNAKIIFSILFFYFIINTIYQKNIIERVLYNDIVTLKSKEEIKINERRQDLYYNYNLASFQPNNQTKEIVSNSKLNKIPIVIEGCEPHDISNYLELYNKIYYPNHTAIDSLLKQTDSLIVVTNHPKNLIQDSLFLITMLNKNINYHTYFLYSKKIIDVAK